MADAPKKENVVQCDPFVPEGAPILPIPSFWLKLLCPFSLCLFLVIFITFGVIETNLQSQEIQDMEALGVSSAATINFFKVMSWFGEADWYVIVIIITYTGPYFTNPSLGKKIIIGCCNFPFLV